MKAPGEYTYAELMRQPEVWAKCADVFAEKAAGLLEFWSQKKSRQLFFTGCGSAYFSGLTLAAAATHLLRMPAQAFPASEMVLFPELTFVNDATPLLVAPSRSGETSETLLAVEAFRKNYPGAHVLALSCDADSSLVKASDFALIAPVEEKSIVQTGSLTGMMLLTLGALALWADEPAVETLARAAEAGRTFLNDCHELAQELGNSDQFDRFFFLGSGGWRGVAGEAMLKVKEMSFCQSESFHTLEFRHGLAANATERSLVAGFISARTAAHELPVLAEMGALGAHTLAIGVDEGAEWNLPLPGGLPEWALYPLSLPVAHIIGQTRALKNGRDPDSPANLKSFIKLESPLT